MDRCSYFTEVSVGDLAPCDQNDIPTGLNPWNQGPDHFSDLSLGSIAAHRVADVSTGRDAKPGDVKRIRQIT